MSTPHLFASPARYRMLSQPHATMEAANDSVNGFLAAVEEAREKWKITDVELIISGTAMEGERERPIITSAHLGDPMNSEWMCAYGLASAKRDREDRMLGIMKEVLGNKHK